MAAQPASFGSVFGVRIQAAFWIVFFSSALYLSTGVLGWLDSLFRTVLAFTCHLLNFYVCYSWLVPEYFEKKKYALAAVGLIILLIGITPVRVLIENDYPVRQAISRMRPAGLVVFCLFTEITIAGFASLLRLALSHDHNTRKMDRIEKMQLETELRFLKAQINPHFLFNSINNIYSLTLTRSDKAPDALMKLSELLRYLLYECHDKVPLHREVKAIREYAELFQLKYESPVNLAISVQVSSLDRMIESLLLIPLLENVTKHAGLGLDPEAFARFTISEKENTLYIEVVNSKSNHSEAVEKGGIGLQNIQKRLQMVYPDKHTFTIHETPSQFSVLLTIPAA